MSNPLFPLGWHWLADDGRIFSAPKAAIVDKSDPGFVAFGEAGNTPTRWPADNTGAQTVATMQDVMRPYSIMVPDAPRSVQGAVLIHALDKATKVTARDLAYVAGLDAAREDMASIIRIATVDGSTAKAWFDAALGVTS